MAIKCIQRKNSDIVRIISYNYDSSKLVKLTRSGYHKTIVKNDASRLGGLYRAKRRVKGYAENNNWDYMVTFTFDMKKLKFESTELQKSAKTFMLYIKNYLKKYEWTYLLVPELHKSGRLHLHGLVKTSDKNVKYLKYDKEKQCNIYRHKLIFNRFGANRWVKISRFTDNITRYITEYMVKELSFTDLVRYYFVSKGISFENVVYQSKDAGCYPESVLYSMNIHPDKILDKLDRMVYSIPSKQLPLLIKQIESAKQKRLKIYPPKIEKFEPIASLIDL